MSFISIREAAQVLKISERHIRRMIREGKWPFYQFGRRMIKLDLNEIINLGHMIAEGRPKVPKDQSVK
jgi:excisionase family DNA binding protein